MTTITCAVSLTGFPAVSVPAGRLPGELPFGLQLVAAPGRDHMLLQIAARAGALEGHGHGLPA